MRAVWLVALVALGERIVYDRHKSDAQNMYSTGLHTL